MTDTNQQQAAPSEQAPQTTTIPSLDERSAAVFGEMTPADASNEAPAEATPPTADQAALDRRARLKALQDRERETVDAKNRRREAEEYRGRLAEAERRLKAAEEMAQKRIDVETLDVDGLLGLLERGKVEPAKIAERIRELTANPEIAAAQAARKTIDPEIASLRATVAAQQEALNKFIAQQQTQAEAAQEAAATRELVAFTQENAATSPIAARFLSAYGQDEFYKLALGAAGRVPPGAGWQAVLDDIEENLSTLAPIYQPAQQAKQTPPSHPAAAKAPTTVSNTLAQGRASVVDEDADWASLSFEERSARIFGMT